VNVAPILDPVGDQSVDELTLLSFTATASDVDLPANTLTFSLSGAPAGAAITAGGDFTWTPTEAQGPGSYVFDVIVTDNGTPNLADSETITVTVGEINVAPILDPVGGQSVDELTLLSFTATASDVDLPANTLTFSLSGAPVGAAITAGGDFTWTPTEAQGPGSYVFDVVVTDNGTPNLADSETITVTVGEINGNVPVAVDDGYGTIEGGTLTVADPAGVLLNDTDADIPADVLTVTVVADAAHGSLVLDPNGGFTYVHDDSENHADFFTYEVFDGVNTSLAGTVTLNITPVNDQAPVAVDDSYGPISEGGSLAVPVPGVLVNDSDGDLPGDVLTPAVSVPPSHGALTLNPDGSLSYVHDDSENFLDSFEYELSDGVFPPVTATVTVSIDPVNDNPPSVPPSVYVVDEGGTLARTAAAGVLAGGTDLDGDTITVTPVDLPSYGSLVLLPDGSFTYIHDGTENFSDGFTFMATDGLHVVGPVAVTLSINPVNEAPFIDPLVLTPFESTTPGSAMGTPVAGDPDGDTLLYSFSAPTPVFAIDTLTGEISLVAGLDYETVPAYLLNVTVTDPLGASASADVTITVVDVDEAPFSASATFPIVEDLPLGSTIGTISGIDPEGGPVSFAIVGGDPSGRFTVDPATGELILVAGLDATLTPSYLLSLEVADTGGNVTPVAVIVIVNPVSALPSVNLAPVGLSDNLVLDEDTSVLIAPLLNDSDPDGDPLLVSWIDTPLNGTLTANADGTYLYRPDLNYYGSEVLSYSISDGRGGSDTSAISLLILSVNDVPVTPDLTALLEFTPELLIPVPGGTIDPDGDRVTITVSDPANGTVEITGGGFLYTPPAEWNGTDTFTYVATDPHGGASSGLVTVTVTQIDGDLVAIDLVSAEPVPEPTPTRAPNIVVENIELLVGTVTEMAGLLTIPLIAVAAAFVASILFGLSRNFLIGRGPVFLPATAPGSVAIVRVPPGGVVTALEGPGEEFPLVHRYGPAELGIRSTGRRAQRGSTMWIEVETPEGDAWIIERLLTEEVPIGLFASDDHVTDLMDRLMEAIERRDELSPMVSEYGLEVAYYAPPKNIAGDELARLLTGEESWGWWDPTGTTPSVRGEFVTMVADPLREMVASIDGRAVAEAVVEIPVELVNFPSLTFSSPDKLGWRVFFDYRDDEPKLAAIWREGVTNPASV
ncbi:MAG: Ig-like domain-containing protein, partial [Acidimicrobiia bacterium]